MYVSHIHSVSKHRPNKAVTVLYILPFGTSGWEKRDHWNFFNPGLINEVIFNQKKRERHRQTGKYRDEKHINILNVGSRPLK